MSSFLFFVPAALVILLVLEACRHDDPVLVLRRSLRNFMALSAALLVGSAFVYVVNRWF